MAGMTTEQQRALALANARKRKAEAQQSQGVDGFWSGVNRGLSNIYGGPVDLINAAVVGPAGRAANKVFGTDFFTPSESPFGGSRSVRRGMRLAGIRAPEESPSTLSGKIGEGVGEAAAAAVPMLGIAGRASRIPQAASATSWRRTAGDIAQDMNRMAVNKPLAAAATELGAGAGVGTGRYITKNTPENSPLRTWAEVVGGLAGSATGNFATTGGLAGKAASAFKEFVRTPFSRESSKRYAAKRVQEMAEDIMGSVARLDITKDSMLSPMTRTGDIGLMQLEQTVLKRTNRIGQFESELEDNIDLMVKHLRSMSSGDVADTRRALELRKQRFDNAIEARIAKADADAAQKIEALGPRASNAETGVAVREQLDSALADARAQENELWEKVPTDLKVKPENFVKRYASLKDELGFAKRKNMPVEADEFRKRLSEEVKPETVKELQGLRSELGEVARRSRADGKYNAARAAEELRDALIKDIESNEKVNPALQEAIAFSRSLNKKFKEGFIGKVLGYAREGGNTIPDELTTERLIGSGGARGQVAVSEISEATGDKALPAVAEYYKSLFLKRAATPNGRIHPQRANAFIEDNKAVLENFPALKAQMQTAVEAEDMARKTKTLAEGMRNRYQKMEVGSAGAVLKSPPGREIASLLRTQNPGDAAKGLMARVKGNSDAVKGLRAALVEYLISGNKPDFQNVNSRGIVIPRGMQMKAAINDPKMGPVIDAILSPQEKARYSKIATELARAQVRSGINAGPDQIVKESPFNLFRILMGYIGANVGSATGQGVGKLRTANILSNFTEKLSSRLLKNAPEQIVIDATQDDELLEALLTMSTDPVKKQKAATRKLNAWIAGPGSRVVAPEDEETLDTRP